MRIIVYHRGYGCDTGCCGHAIRVNDASIEHETFDFAHPWLRDESPREFAERWVREEFGEAHVADLDWENCDVIYGEDC